MLTPHAIATVDHAVSALEQFVASSLGEYGHGAHRSIPYSPTRFAEVFQQFEPCRFLDVGCGLGSKLLQAQMFGFTDITGLEIFTPYADFARQLTGMTIINVDAFKFDRYDEFDLVYMWWPRVEDEDQANLERFVESRMRPGSTIYFAESSTGPEVRTVR